MPKATIGDITVNYDISGASDAPPVILHHPLATNLSIWDELTAALGPHYRVIRFDARGHGASDAPTGAYDFAQLSNDVIHLMDHLGIEKARFLGLSMGGFVGQHLGVRHGDRFHSLCLVSTASASPPEARPIWDERIRLAREEGMQSQVQPGLERWLSDDARANNADLVARLSNMIAATPEDGFIGWARAIVTLNITDQLKTITVPTRVIVGELDPATPVVAAQTIHQNIKGSDLIIMPDVSHMLCAEAPETFHDHVLPFLATHGPAPK